MSSFQSGGGYPLSPNVPQLSRTPSENVRRNKAKKDFDKMSSREPASDFDPAMLSPFEKMVCDSISRGENYFIEEVTITKMLNIFYSIDVGRTDKIDVSYFKDDMGHGVNQYKRQLFNQLTNFLDINLDRNITKDEYVRVMVLRALRWKLVLNKQGGAFDKLDHQMTLSDFAKYTRNVFNMALEEVMKALNTIVDP